MYAEQHAAFRVQFLSTLTLPEIRRTIITTANSWHEVISNKPKPDEFNSFDTISCTVQVQVGKGIEETNNNQLSCQSEGNGGPV